MVSSPAFGDSAAIQAKQAEAQHVLAEIGSLDTSLEKAIEAYDAATQKLHKIEANLKVNLHELHVAKANLVRSQRVVAQRLVTLYTTGDTESSLGVLLGAGNISDLVNRANTANLVAGQDVQVQHQVISFKKQVREERIRLKNARAAQQSVVQQRADAKASIQSQLAQRRQLVASIRNQIVQMRQAEARRQAQLAAEARARARAAAAAPPPVVSSPVPSSSSGGGAVNPPPSAVGGSVVSIAERYLGVPYVWGGASPSGFDCSGFTMYVYAQVGVSLPHNAAAQYGVGSPVSMGSLEPGDLVFFYGLGHVGIYIGGGQMIDAPYSGASVRVDPVGTPVAIRRIDGSAAATGGPGAGAPAAWGASVASGRPADLSISSYTSDFVAAGNAHGVPATLLAAVARTESGLDPTATSPAGAEGLMQLMPQTAASLGVDPWDPAQAIDGAAQLLAADKARFGTWPLAIAAYTAGAGAVASYGGIPPYPETQAYVTKVLSAAGMST